MAEGILNDLYGDRFEAYSAGAEPTTVNPLAISVLSEIGIDISHGRSKHVSEFVGKDIDYVVTLCKGAKETCPFFPGAREYIHHGVDDPAAITDSREALESFRQVRDELKEWITKAFGSQSLDRTQKGMRFELQLE